MKNIWYPSENDVIKANRLMIAKFKATKSENHKVLSIQNIRTAIQNAKDYPGEIEDKAVVLLDDLQYHPFASANRRTAYYIMNQFLWKNKGYGVLKEKAEGQRFMKRIRAREMTHEDIKREISNGI